MDPPPGALANNPDGDLFRRAFTEKNIAIVRAVARKRARDPEAARDIEQSIWTHLFESALKKWNAGENLGRFIARCAVNHAIDYYRRNRKHDGGDSIEASMEEGKQFPGSPFIDAERMLLIRAVRECMDKLDPNQKAAIEYSMMGYEYEEIKEFMAAQTTSAVATWIFRGKDKIRRCMGVAKPTPEEKPAPSRDLSLHSHVRTSRRTP